MSVDIYKLKKLLKFQTTHFYELQDKGIGHLEFIRLNSETAASDTVISFRVFGELLEENIKESIISRNVLFNKLKRIRKEHSVGSGDKYFLSIIFNYDNAPSNYDDVELSTPFSIAISVQDEGLFLSAEDIEQIETNIFTLIDELENELQILVSEFHFLHPKSFIQAVRHVDYLKK